MIQNGQKFNHYDLFQSVSEIMITDWKKFLHTPLPFYFDDDKPQDLAKMGPLGYASLIIYSYEHKSSAHYLDNQLKDKGYKTTYSFAHKYHIPEDLRSRILPDTARLSWIYEICHHPNLTKKEYDDLTPVFKNAANVSYYYAQLIWANDKEAKFNYHETLLPFRDWDKTLDFLFGTAFEFHPKDVYKHITSFDVNGIEYKKQLVFKNWCKNNFDIDTGCLVLSDENMDKLRAILTKTDEPYIAQVIKKFFKTLTK